MKLFEKIKNKKIKCLACEHKCEIPESQEGVCGVRRNKNQNLELIVYGKPCSLAIDPIEKKPLHKFLPGTDILSLGTFGCNFNCKFCQNHSISQKPFRDFAYGDIQPQQIVSEALEKRIPSIAYTYNEPTVFFEFAYDIGILARKNNLKNVFVSNGFMSEVTLEKSFDFLDAVNFDLKSFSDEFYKKTCGGKLAPVLRNIRKAYQAGIHIEITTLLVTDLNDSEQEIKNITEFILDLSPEVPWHISRFFPCFKMKDVAATPLEKLFLAREIAERMGLKNVYLGNV